MSKVTSDIWALQRPTHSVDSQMFVYYIDITLIAIGYPVNDS